MNHFYIFDEAQGTARLFYSSVEDDAIVQSQVLPGETWVAVGAPVDLRTEYASEGGVFQKQSLGVQEVVSVTADGVDTVSIAVPTDVFVTWPDGVRERVEDGVVEFGTYEPGDHKLRFDGIQYQTAEVTIEARI